MNKKEQLEALKNINTMMNRSERFLSLSGLSGVAAGSFAIIASVFVYLRIGSFFVDGKDLQNNTVYFVILGMITFLCTIVTAYFFTRKKSIKSATNIWNKTSKTALINMSIPLIVGGLFCSMLIFHGYHNLVMPLVLIFYGLSLISVSKNTFEMIKTLGFVEIILGILNVIFLGYDLIFWFVGFGLFHIGYGLFMYFKYEG